MRIRFHFQLKKPELDIEYRRVFLSLLKKSFQQTSQKVYEKFYENGTVMKPFTFSLFLPGAEFLQDKIMLKNQDITLFFTTVLKDIGIYFYNSLLRTRFNPFPLPDGNSLQLSRVVLQREKKINSSEVVFKTMSPFLVRLHHRESNKDEYLLADDERFNSQFKIVTHTLFKELTGKEEEVDIHPVKLDKIPVRHYGILVESQKGIIKLSGKPETLNFLYRSGIGSKRSEGFGMLEVVQ